MQEFYNQGVSQENYSFTLVGCHFLFLLSQRFIFWLGTKNTQKIPVLDATLTMFMVLLHVKQNHKRSTAFFLKKSGFHTMKHVWKHLQVC